MDRLATGSVNPETQSGFWITSIDDDVILRVDVVSFMRRVDSIVQLGVSIRAVW